jgi:cytochrome c-type biogenesis protein CcmH
MILFWTMAALLMVLALGLVLPSLLQIRQGVPTQVEAVAGQANLAILREQLALADAELAAGGLSPAQHAQARSEIERRALDEATALEPSRQPQRALRTAVLTGLAVPLLAVGLYGVLGDSRVLAPLPVAAQGEAGGVTMEEVEAMVAKLAQRLESAQDAQAVDPKAWEMLARSYAVMQRFGDAAKAYAKANQLTPDNAQLLADHADVLAMLPDASATEESARLITRALQIDPANLKALALAGRAAYERKDMSAALRYWTLARQAAPEGSEFAAGLDRSLDMVRSEAPAASAGPAVQLPGASAGAGKPVQTAASATSAGTVSGVLRLDPALAGRVAPDDTVFIFARPAQGPRMPLAVLRRKASELPINFMLDDSTAMSKELRLSGFEQVIVGARISRSGNATPQSGDFTGQSGPLKTGAAGIALLIDSVQP